MEENLDDTVVVRRGARTEGTSSGEADLDDTVLAAKRLARAPAAAAQPAAPPTLVEPPEREERPSGSAFHLTPPPNSAPPAPAAPVRDERAARAPQGHYRFRLIDKVVSLDAVAFIGRSPSSPRIASGRMPRLVRVSSPAREVSSTHVELRQSGGAVVVTDMRSTNGTIVTIPRRKPRKLRQGESVVVTPGTLVDIGDGNVIEILPMQEEHQ